MTQRSLVRRLLLMAGLALLLATIVTAWVGWNAAQGGRELREAAGQLTRTSLGADTDGREVERVLASAARSTREARQRFEDPVVQAVAGLPIAGRPLQTATSIAISTDAAVGGALLPLSRSAGSDPQASLFREGGGIDVGFLASLADPSEQASRTLDSAINGVRAAPARTRIAALDEARAEVVTELGRLNAAVSSLSLVARLGPELLGSVAPRRYLLIPQNPAEARGTGGLVGGFVLLEADAGRLRTVESGANTVFEHFLRAGKQVVDLGAEYDEHYGHNGPTRAWVNSNLSPHFPYAAATWQALWREQTGQQVDGVMALDPIALSYLLRATGPVQVSDGQRVTAENVVQLTLRDAYVAFDSAGGPLTDRRDERKQYLQEVAAAVGQRLTTTRPDGRGLIRALTRAVDERRLLLWTGDAQVDGALAPHAITGQLPARPAVGDVIVNAGGSKLDYYLDRSLRYQQGCGSPSTLTLTMTNTAPATGLPAYVNPPQYRKGLPEGTNESIVTLYLPLASRVEAVRIGDEDARYVQGAELGHRWVEVFVTLRPGASSDVVVEFTETAGSTAAPERIAQPLVRPEAFTAQLCDGRSD